MKKIYTYRLFVILEAILLLPITVFVILDVLTGNKFFKETWKTVKHNWGILEEPKS